MTNPPYLAKNKAKKINIENFDNNYSDLYLNALDKMLNNCDFVACIIPESFITSGQYIWKIILCYFFRNEDVFWYRNTGF
ncbi:hypothetical protein [Mycoplasmopsis felis]|uniref:hypothetical protein n=1 Tax=Mycoplasmopsis felis TaxID=33923 RepID=UPI003A5C8386